MITKGNLHSHGQKLAAYLITGKMDERAELAEVIRVNDARRPFRTRCSRVGPRDPRIRRDAPEAQQTGTE